MLFKITRKEYNKLKSKYMDCLDKIENQDIVIESLKNTIKQKDKKLDEMKYRETLREQDIEKLNNAISNSLEEINRLNIKLVELKKKPKRGRPRKNEEVK